MKRLMVAVLAGALVVPALAATKTYQVTGPIVDVRDDAIVIEKGKEKWEIGRDANTKVKGDLKKGARATVHYRMSAADIDVKEAKSSGKSTTKSSGKTEDKGTGAAAH